MSKAKTGMSGTLKPVPVRKTTRQGTGRNSRPSHGRKLPRGQGR